MKSGYTVGLAHWETAEYTYYCMRVYARYLHVWNAGDVLVIIIFKFRVIFPCEMRNSSSWLTRAVRLCSSHLRTRLSHMPNRHPFHTQFVKTNPSFETKLFLISYVQTLHRRSTLIRNCTEYSQFQFLPTPKFLAWTRPRVNPSTLLCPNCHILPFQIRRFRPQRSMGLPSLPLIR